jgi:hypothetical protein
METPKSDLKMDNETLAAAAATTASTADEKTKKTKKKKKKVKLTAKQKQLVS